MSSCAAEGLRLGMSRQTADFQILLLNDKVRLLQKIGRAGCAMWGGITAWMCYRQATPQSILFCAGVTALGLCILRKCNRLQQKTAKRSQDILNATRQIKQQTLAATSFTRLKELIEPVIENPSSKQALFQLFEKVLANKIQHSYLYNEAENTPNVIISLLEPTKSIILPQTTLHLPSTIRIRLAKDGTLTFPDATAAPYIEKVHFLFVTSRFTVYQMQKEAEGFSVATQRQLSLLRLFTKGTPYATHCAI